MYGFSGHSWSLLCTDFPDTSDSKCLDFPDASVWIFRTGCLDFPYRVLFFLALKNDPIPAQKITGRRVGHVSYFSQPPVRCLALAVDAKARPGCYYAKAIVLYLSETARGSFFVHANLFCSLADRKIYSAVVFKIGAIPLLESDIDASGAWRHRSPSGRCNCFLK
jgi:hypothetical protein